MKRAPTDPKKSRRMRLTPEIINAIGRDAGNASMRAAGRKVWSVDDWNAGVAAESPLWAAYDRANGLAP